MRALLRPADSTCACGQPLECSHTRHCPRCGVTLPPESGNRRIG